MNLRREDKTKSGMEITYFIDGADRLITQINLIDGISFFGWSSNHSDIIVPGTVAVFRITKLK